VPDRSVVTVVHAAVGQRSRLGDHDVVGAGAQQCVGAASLGRLEHAPDRAPAGRRGLLPAVAVGELAQLGELAIAERQHAGKRGGQRPAPGGGPV
jgi:hypothetical protein